MSNGSDRLLNDGVAIPAMGFGVFRVPNEEAGAAVADAIQLGYRAIDTAAYYKNEVGTGEGIRSGQVRREQLHVTTKVWHLDLGYTRTVASVEESLRRLNLDYLDLVLIHWPAPDRGLYLESWEALIDVRSSGLTKSIGVSNFNPTELTRIVEATGVRPAVNQVELHLRLPQESVRTANHQADALTQAWSPLGHGELLKHPAVRRVAYRLSYTPAQVLLRWCLDTGAMPITESLSPDRMRSNLASLGLPGLGPRAHSELAALNDGYRTGPDPAIYGT
jgi:2,5-diketo-D-gluconate reductase A